MLFDSYSSFSRLHVVVFPSQKSIIDHGGANFQPLHVLVFFEESSGEEFSHLNILLKDAKVKSSYPLGIWLIQLIRKTRPKPEQVDPVI